MSETEPNEEKEKTYNIRVVISSLGNERRTVHFKEMSKEESQRLIETVSVAFETVRRSNALFLTGSDGQVIFANLDNVAFVEVQIAE